MIFRVILAALIGGGVLAYMGFNQFRLANKVGSEPADVTLDELAAGEADNAHVTLTDFFAPGDYISLDDKSGLHETVWLPVVGFDSNYMRSIHAQLDANGGDFGTVMQPAVAGSEVRVVIKSTDCRGATDVGRLAEREFLTGVVVNDIEGLDGETKKLLREAYPGMDVDDVLIVHADRGLPSAGGALGMMAGGVGLTGAGAVGAVARHRRGKAS